MRFIVIFILFLTLVFSSEVKEEPWGRGETFLSFLDNHNIPAELYFNLGKTDQELCSEITAGVAYQSLYDKNGNLEQVLIPISEEMQIHLYKREGKFLIDFIPIQFYETEQSIAIPIKNSPYQDIIETTGNKLLANELMRAFKKSVDFRKLRVDDIVAINFKQKVRLGRYFGTPEINAALVEIRKSKNFIFKHDADSRYYDEKGRSLTSFFLRVPVKYTRISDKFTNKRFHPILKRYRAHLGIDYAAPTGRQIYAAADGKIIYKGRKGGYGKTIMISHKGSYKSLYAHMHNYAKVKVGQRVKQGTLIGYVGSTGRSTGPHLHFGLYKNGKAINPEKVVKITKNRLKDNALKEFMKSTQDLKEILTDTNLVNKTPLKLENVPYKSEYTILKEI